jgi:DNA alkylation repair enzyme
MSKRATTPQQAATEIRRVLRAGGSAAHAAGVQWFFQEEIKSHGWYTAALRKAARRFRRSVMRERGMDFVVQVADKLFSGRNLEEGVCGISAGEADAKFWRR